MTKRSISRRKFVGSAAAGSAAMLGARAGDASATMPAAPARARARSYQEATDVKYAKVIETMPAAFAEAPMLTEMVTAGTIPALAERLPKEPMVVEPIEVGVYGGTARVGDISTNLGGYDIKYATGGPVHLLRYTPDLAATEPNVASGIDVSEDQTTYTIHLRPGMKWSDGKPVTAADMMFMYEDILLNTEITPTFPLDLSPGEKPVVMMAPDEFTVVMTFAVPHPRFLLSNCPHQYGWPSARQIHASEYLKQFHLKYNPNATAEAEAEGFATWVERFNDMNNEDINAALPTLRAFVAEEDSPTLVRYRRNPFFWAVDSAGNQLPYMDYVEMERLQDVQTYHAKIVTGAFDYAVGNGDILNFSTYQSSEASAGYKTLLWSSGRGGEVFFQVNFNFGDEVLKKVTQDVRYRQALSVAINREEVNQLLFFGAAVPRQMTVLPTSVHFKPEYETPFAQYDVALANQLLDELGLTWNDDQTMRLLPNGQPMQFKFDYFDGEGPKTSILELITAYWRAVGIHVTASSITRQLLAPRIETNEEPMSMWHGDASTDILLPVDRKWSTGKAGDECSIAPLWNLYWQTDGREGEEPAEWYATALDTWRRFSETLDPAVAAELLQSQADNLWSIGTVGMTPWPFVVKDRMGNVAETGIHTWDGLFQFPFHAETLFLRQ